MRRFAITLAALSPAIAQGAAAQENDPARFVAATDWAIDYGEDYCRLARGFAHEDQQLTIAFDRIQPGPVARLMISGNGLSPARGARQMGFQFLPEGEARLTQMLRAASADGGSVVNFGEIYLAPLKASTTREDRRALRGQYRREDEKRFGDTVEGLRVDTGFARPALIETGELGAPIEALQACADQLVAHWGLDAQRHRTMRRPAVPANDMTAWLPGGTIGQREFPLLWGAQNQVRLTIDAQGIPTGCAIHFASLPPKTNESVCAALLENARFSAARDAADAPMESYWITQLGFLAVPGG